MNVSGISCLDYHSSKPVDPAVLEAMKPFMLTNFGNPSSLHGIGDMATEALEVGRTTVAGFVNADRPQDIVFTSGATESNNLALIGYANRNKRKGKHVVISEVEHISILNIGKYLQKQGFEVTRVPVSFSGKVRLEKVREKIREDTILVSIQHANNEVGTIHPINEIGEILRDLGAAFHVDAVASEELLPIDVERDKIDLLTLSSNDLYGPKGIGALYVREGIKLSPIIIGGGQERGLRSGTENLPGVVGMAKAIELAVEKRPVERERLTNLRDLLIGKVLETIPRSHLNGHKRDRLPSNAHFRFDYIEGESLLLKLKDAGIAISTGSACSSKTLEPSHTLIAMGLLHEEAHGSLEVTLGRWTEKKDIDKLLAVLPGTLQELRALSPLAGKED